MTMAQVRRNQVVIAAISTVLLITLWFVGNLPRYMFYALPFVIVSLWVPAVLAYKQREGSLVWNLFFGGMGIAVISIVGRAVWLIGRS